MNPSVTLPYMSAMVIPILMMIHPSWLKKISVDSGKVAQKGTLVLKIDIFQGECTP